MKRTVLIAFAAVVALVLLFLATVHAASQQVPSVICQQYDKFDLNNGHLIPDPDLPLWLRHQAALRDHCPVDPPWGSLASDSQQIS